MEPTPTAPISPTALLRLDQATGTLRERRYRVMVVAGEEAGKSVRLDGTLFVGSHPDAGLRLSDATVSRYHLELQARGDGVLVKDLNSTNGTFIGGARIQEVVVEKEATFLAGKTVLHISLEEKDLGKPEYDKTSFGTVMGQSSAMRQLFGILDRVAASESTVVLLGETGTGKEVLAQALHQASSRKDKPFVVIDCGAVAPTLIESELFGHLKGAYTGATSDRIGAFLKAEGGTIFLDEIGELPLDLQPKLLRVLE